MADPRKGATVATGGSPPAEVAKVEATSPTSAATNSEELATVRKELSEMKESQKRLNNGIRHLSAAILTPAGTADKGQGRRNAIAQAIQGIVKEFGFEDEE